jgi:hypothetical protein
MIGRTYQVFRTTNISPILNMRAKMHWGMVGTVIATARKKETEIGFPDYIEKAETGAIGRALAMCGYGTLQALECDEQDRLADAPVEK